MMELFNFKAKLEEALKKRQSACFFCRCEVLYEGRAESRLPEGDRIVIVKGDRTILIHQPEGQNPINYMKAGTEFTFEENVLKCYNPKFSESIELTLYDVYNFVSSELKDGQKLSLFGSEKDMSDMIKENPALISCEFKPLSREEHVKFGFVDVFGHDGKGNLVIVECKRFSAGLKDVGQLRRYVDKMKKLRGVSNIRGILASPAITASAMEMLKEYGFEWARVEPPRRRESRVKDQQRLERFM